MPKKCVNKSIITKTYREEPQTLQSGLDIETPLKRKIAKRGQETTNGIPETTNGIPETPEDMPEMPPKKKKHSDPTPTDSSGTDFDENGKTSSNHPIPKKISDTACVDPNKFMQRLE